MEVRRRCKSARAAAGAAALGLVVWLAASAAAGAAAQSGGPEASQPERADAATIKTEIENILSAPQYQQRPSLAQAAWDWLWEKLGRWDAPLLTNASGVVGVIVWLVFLWCIVTLAAILAHLGWTVVTAWRASRRSGPAAGGALHFSKGALRASLKDLEALHARLAGEGRFREAVGVLMLALLRRLESAGVLAFHESKTNGDYVREFAVARAGRDNFRRVVHAFDATIYAGRTCGPKAYRQFSTMCDQVHRHARPES